MVVDTIPALFLNAVRNYDKADAFRHKRDGCYIAVSHADVLLAVDRASMGLGAFGLAKGDRIAILSENRLEWAIADLAILSAGCINVPIYATLPARQVAYILGNAEVRAVFVSSREQLDKVLAVRSELSTLRHVIAFDENLRGEGVTTLQQLLERGESVPEKAPYESRIATIGKYDWASILYTSGTTGDPKGAILNHANFVSNATSAAGLFPIGPQDTCLSFLPLSHTFERTCGYYIMLHKGVTIAYAESMESVAENMIEASPTIVISVPRLYEKMYAKVLETVTSASSLRKGIFHWSRAAGERFVKEKLENRLRRSTKLRYALARRLVFGKLRARTGGRLRFFISGGAPLARDIAEFFYAAGLPVLEGYGLTETAPVITVNTFDHFKFGTVGKPIPGVDVQIASDGEILARGPNVMLGYYKKPDLTSEVLDGKWFRTGDIGFLDDDGFLTITDRKKDIIVTAGGKNVAPQPIENLLKQSKYISQIVVVGNRRKFVSALIVPDFDHLRYFADAIGIPSADAAALLAHPKVMQKYEEEIARLSEHLAGFERVKRFVLIPREFTIESGELTPTLKAKRALIEKKYEGEITRLYTTATPKSDVT